MNKGKTEKFGKYYQFYLYIQKCNADRAKKLLDRLKYAAAAGNCHICMWILKRRFSADFDRCEYRKINAVSENKNENVEIVFQEADILRKRILAKFD